ncbi:amidase [Luteipulveratus sp. YIM 133132]|uniref:amidase n=1 Tax=Luteipulveratus flavus TaxID=3031728 RepID=UPI0023AF2504|nr:amidase [Luteipulveratus sp. YIM 133132]MDE9367809.1 amidase [Luteipulveratus sp. YIM 133132]
MTVSLNLLPAAELVAGFGSGAWDPVDAYEASVAAVRELDRHVNAIVMLDEEAGAQAAKESARRWQSGETLSPVDGVPITIKDIVLTRGWPTLKGSSLVDSSGPWEDDAPATARLRESGAVIFGKNTTPEFGWKGVTDSARHGVTRNPWDPSRTSGGSSGGAAAATALGMGTWSVGTDGGGSVRIPGSFSGVVALKPTYGQVPVWPASAYGTLSHVGPMTRTVQDCALLLDVLARPDARDWSALGAPASSYAGALDGGVAGLRVAFSPDLGYGHNDPAVDAAVRAAVEVLADLGARVSEIDLGLDDPVEAFHVLWFSGAAKVLRSFDRAALARVEPALAQGIREYGLDASAADYLDATEVRMSLGQRMGELHRTYDVLVTPTMPITAFTAGQAAPDGWPSWLWTSWTPYTYPFNMTQQPALTVPCGFDADGLPIGLQVVGPRHADALVLRVGQAYEQATDWHTRRPPLLNQV